MHPGKIIVEKEIENDAIAIPKSAVLWAGQRAVVYVKLPKMMILFFNIEKLKLVVKTQINTGVLTALKREKKSLPMGRFALMLLLN